MNKSHYCLIRRIFGSVTEKKREKKKILSVIRFSTHLFRDLYFGSKILCGKYHKLRSKEANLFVCLSKSISRSQCTGDNDKKNKRKF